MSALGSPVLSVEDAKSAVELGMTANIWHEITSLNHVSGGLTHLIFIIEIFEGSVPTTTEEWYTLIGKIRAERAVFGPVQPVFSPYQD